MKDFLTYLITPLVTDLNAVEIEETQTENQIELSLRVPETEMGHIIGKQGKTIQALRQLLRLKGTLNNQTIIIKLLEPNQ